MSLLTPEAAPAAVQKAQQGAQDTAQAAIVAKRKELLATGGKTQYTPPGGSPFVLGDLSYPTLLGR